MQEKYCVSLELAKRLEPYLKDKDVEYWWVNSSYSSGFEGGECIWLCDKQWHLLSFKPDPQYDDTGKMTKKEGLVPDYCISNRYSRKKHDEYTNKIRPEKIKNIKIYKAPHAGELLEWMPQNRVRLTKWMGDWYCELYHKNPLATDGETRKIADTPVGALGLMLEYLYEKGL